VEKDEDSKEDLSASVVDHPNIEYISEGRGLLSRYTGNGMNVDMEGRESVAFKTVDSPPFWNLELRIVDEVRVDGRQDRHVDQPGERERSKVGQANLKRWDR
jgi:hypothetical protein